MKALIFDFDGTIAKTYPILIEYAEELNRKYGKNQINPAEIKNIGLKASILKAEIPFWKMPALIRDIKEIINQRIALDVKVTEGLSEVIKLASKKYNLGIVSSNSKNSIDIFLKKNKLDKYFKFVFSESSIFGKHLVLSRMCKKYNLIPKDTYYVGDEDRDIVAAKKSGLITIAVTWGFNSEKLLKSHNPDYLIGFPKQLREILSV